MPRSDKILQMKTCDFYRLYNGPLGLWFDAVFFCRDFCGFCKSLPCFFAIFCRDFLLSLDMDIGLYRILASAGQKSGPFMQIHPNF